jgi:multidrug efflux pump subunit AcrA (membrane-fusion protein)
MKKLFRVVCAILLGLAGGYALLSYCLPDTSAPDAATLTAYLEQPAPAPRPAPAATATVAVPATAAGRVWEVYFLEGQRVRKGQLLLKVAQKLVSADHRRLQQQLARQQQAAAALAARQPAAPAAELAAALALAAATQQQLAQLPAQLSFLFVTAPSDGIVARRTVAAGDYLALGATVALLAPLPSVAEDTTLLLSSIN